MRTHRTRMTRSSAASQSRGRSNLGGWSDPGSAARHCMPRCARDKPLPHQHVLELPRIALVDVFREQTRPAGERRPVGVRADHRAEIGRLDFEAALVSPSRRLRRCPRSDSPAPRPCRRARRRSPAGRWRSGTAQACASLRSRAASRTSRRSSCGRRAARRVRRCRRRSRARRGCACVAACLPACRTIRAATAPRRRTDDRRSGRSAGRSTLPAVAHGEIVRDRDRLVVRDEEAVLRRRASGVQVRTRVLAPGCIR